MTRNEFLEDINDFGDLLRFCWNEDCNLLEYVKDSVEYNNWVWECVQDWCDSWESLASWLYGLPEHNDYDYFDTEDEVCGLDGYNFDDYKQRVLEWMDEGGCWDDDGDEGEYEPASHEFFECAPTPEKEPEDPVFLTLLSVS